MSLTSLNACLMLMAAVALFAGTAAEAATDGSGAVTPSPRDYMVTVSRPNLLNLIDLHRNEVVRQCELPGMMAPGTVTVSPQGDIAYVLADGFSDAFGVALDDCEVVFSTRQSEGNIRVKSMASLALSPDGRELYTHQLRVKLLHDRYEIQDPLVAVFDTSAGLEARPVRAFPAPRQVTNMVTDAAGALYLGGPDIFRMDVGTGAYEVALPSRSLNDPAYSQRDILSVWPLGEVNGEWVRMFSTARYRGDSGDLDNADFMWGYERVDLQTGETEDVVFGPLDVVLFTSIRRPGRPDRVYGVLNELKEFDASTQSIVRRIGLEHTYYCINFSTDGSRIYLSGALSDVAVYDADSLEKLANIQLSGDMGLSNSYIFNRTAI